MIAPAVLLGNDVLDMKGQHRIIILMYPAILAAVAGAAADQAADGGVHPACFASSSRAWACRIAMKSANAM